MANLNQVVLIGRLTRDAELRVTNTGTPVCKFSLAVNRRRKQGDQWIEEANFFDVVAWGRLGESLHQYLVKGKEVAIQGELRQSRWEQDGQTRSKVEIIANTIQLLGGSTGGSGGSGFQRSNDSFGGSQNSYSGPDSDNGIGDYNDDIPF